MTKSGLHLLQGTKIQLTPAQVAIRQWLKENREILQDRMADEVAYMAVTCGFKLEDVCSTLVDFRDAMLGQRMENRAEFHLFRFEIALRDFLKLKHELETPKELDLMPLWKDLADNTTQH